MIMWATTHSFREVGPTTLNKSGLVFYRDIRMLVGAFCLSHLTKPGRVRLTVLSWKPSQTTTVMMK